MADLGHNAVSYVFDRLQIDSEWTIRRDGGFEWWPYDLCQGVWATEPTMSHGMEITELWAETTILQDLRIGPKTNAIVAELNNHATMSSLVIDEERAELKSQTRLFVHNEVFRLTQALFVHAVLLQIAEAHRRVASLAELLESPIAISHHPDQPVRQQPDGMVGAIDDIYLPRGAGESVWPTEEFAAVAETESSPASIVNFGGKGFTAEVPCPVTDSEGEVQESTALIQVDASSQHFDLGSGCLIRLTLPMQVWFEYGPGACVELNRAEFAVASFAQVIGGWTWDSSGSLRFCTFLPNAAYVPGTISLLLQAHAARAAWAADNYQQSIAYAIRSLPTG